MVPIPNMPLKSNLNGANLIIDAYPEKGHSNSEFYRPYNRTIFNRKQSCNFEINYEVVFLYPLTQSKK